MIAILLFYHESSPASHAKIYCYPPRYPTGYPPRWLYKLRNKKSTDVISL